MRSFGPLSRLARFVEDEMGVQGSTKPLLPHENIGDHVMTGVGLLPNLESGSLPVIIRGLLAMVIKGLNQLWW